MFVPVPRRSLAVEIGRISGIRHPARRLGHRCPDRMYARLWPLMPCRPRGCEICRNCVLTALSGPSRRCRSWPSMRPGIMVHRQTRRSATVSLKASDNDGPMVAGKAPLGSAM